MGLAETSQNNMRDDPRLWHTKFDAFNPDTAGMENKKIAKHKA